MAENEIVEDSEGNETVKSDEGVVKENEDSKG